jgi:hypothetical protein
VHLFARIRSNTGIHRVLMVCSIWGCCRTGIHHTFMFCCIGVRSRTSVNRAPMFCCIGVRSRTSVNRAPMFCCIGVRRTPLSLAGQLHGNNVACASPPPYFHSFIPLNDHAVAYQTRKP